MILTPLFLIRLWFEGEGFEGSPCKEFPSGAVQLLYLGAFSSRQSDLFPQTVSADLVAPQVNGK